MEQTRLFHAAQVQVTPSLSQMPSQVGAALSSPELILRLSLPMSPTASSTHPRSDIPPGSVALIAGPRHSCAAPILALMTPVVVPQVEVPVVVHALAVGTRSLDINPPLRAVFADCGHNSITAAAVAGHCRWDFESVMASFPWFFILIDTSRETE